MAAPGATAELSAKHIAELRGQPCSGIPPALASGRGSLHPEKALPHRRGASAGGPAVLSCVLSFEVLTQTLWSKEALWNWTDANVSLKEAPGAWAGAFGPVTERRGSSLCPPRALAQPLLLAGRPVHQTGHTSHPLILAFSSTPREPAVLPVWSVSRGWARASFFVRSESLTLFDAG